MKKDFFKHPIIAAVRYEEDIEDAVKSNVSSIFLLTGTLLNIKNLIKKCRENKKYVFVHMDLLEGLGNDNESAHFISDEVKPDGIISTRSSIIKYAKDYNLYTLQRLFCMDSLAIKTGLKSVEQVKPDAIELLPGIIPRVVSQIVAKVQKPVISGGMITTKEDAIASLKAGAVAISTSYKELWNKVIDL